MSVAIATNSVNEDLIFGYDTGHDVANPSNITRFYPGEPTINLMTAHFESLSTDGSGQSSVGTRTTIATNHVRIADLASNTRQRVDIAGLTAGTTYTLSNQFRKIAGTPTWRYQIQAYNNSSYVSTIKFTNTAEIGITDIDGWQTAKWTFTLPANSNKLVIFFQDGADYTTYNHVFEVKNPQLEAKSHASNYVDGTRSDNDGLLDLKRKTTISLTDAGFDSSSEIDLDGTDDFFETSSIDIGKPAAATFEAVIRFNGTLDSNDRKLFHWPSGTGTNGIAQIRKGINNSRLMYQHHNGTQWYTLTVDNVVVADTFAHIVVTHANATAKMYKNGVEVGSGGVDILYYPSTPPDIKIGYRANSEYWKGNIPLFKIHNTALSASEVKQNYNSYKNRFGI